MVNWNPMSIAHEKLLKLLNLMIVYIHSVLEVTILASSTL